MKRILSFILVLILCFGAFASCNNEEASSDESEASYSELASSEPLSENSPDFVLSITGESYDRKRAPTKEYQFYTYDVYDSATKKPPVVLTSYESLLNYAQNLEFDINSSRECFDPTLFKDKFEEFYVVAVYQFSPHIRTEEHHYGDLVEERDGYSLAYYLIDDVNSDKMESIDTLVDFVLIPKELYKNDMNSETLRISVLETMEGKFKDTWYELEHYPFISNLKYQEEITILSSYDELIDFASEIEFYKANDMSPKNRVEFDIRLFENAFENFFIAVIPRNESGFEQSVYLGYDLETSYRISHFIFSDTRNFEMLESTYSILDFVLIPRAYYNADILAKGIEFNRIVKSLSEILDKYDKLSDGEKIFLDGISDDEYVCLSVSLIKPSQSPFTGSGISDAQLEKRVEQFEREFKAYKRAHGEMDISEVPVDDLRALIRLPDKEVMTDSELIACVSSVGGVEYTIKLYSINDQLRSYRQQVKETNTLINDTFCKSLNMEKCRNVYKDPLITSVSFECKKEYLLEIQKMYNVTSIHIKTQNIVIENYPAENE